MTSSAPHKRPTPAAEVPLDLLRRLARPGAAAQTDPKTGRPKVKPGAPDGKAESNSIPEEHWSWAVRERAIAPDPGNTLWRLTAHGRAILRRHLSTPHNAGRKPLHQDSKAPKPEWNPAESPLAWLRQRKDRDGQPLISDEQFKAGEKLREDFDRAHLNPRVTVSWDGIPSAPGRRSAPGTGVEIRDAVIAAAERVGRALHAVGPELSGILVDVCCHLKGLEGVERQAGWPQRSTRIILLLALTCLARHYGFEGSGRAPSGVMRHWGAAGYRPQIDDAAGENGQIQP